MKLLTTTQVAEMIQMDVVTVRRWARQGRLPAIKVGNRWRIEPDFLESLQTSGGPRTNELAGLSWTDLRKAVEESRSKSNRPRTASPGFGRSGSRAT